MWLLPNELFRYHVRCMQYFLVPASEVRVGCTQHWCASETWLLLCHWPMTIDERTRNCLDQLLARGRHFGLHRLIVWEPFATKAKASCLEVHSTYGIWRLSNEVWREEWKIYSALLVLPTSNYVVAGGSLLWLLMAPACRLRPLLRWRGILNRNLWLPIV